MTNAPEGTLSAASAVTEAEREALREWWDSESEGDTAGSMLANLDAVVGRIIADRAERIARAIEGECDDDPVAPRWSTTNHAYVRAARIARDGVA